MAEAVALVCTALTLATALKDLIELGNKLKDYCEKVSKNGQALERLCIQLPSDLLELEKLYLLNSEAMDNTPALKDAVEQLVLKIKNILEQFEILAEAQPKIGTKVLIKLKSAFRASDVENKIKDLKDDISHCYESFQRLAIARIEITGRSTQTTAEKTYLVVQNLVALTTEQRKEIEVMKSSVQQQLHADDTSVVVASTETITFRRALRSQTLDHLEYQLGNVGVEVTKLTTTEDIELSRRPVKTFALKCPILSYHIPPKKRHRSLLRRILALLEGLEDDATAIDDHALALSALGEVFWSLGMYNEAGIVQTWALKLYRILADLQPQHFAPFLAEALFSQGILGESGAKDEAIKILEPMVGLDSPPDVRGLFAFQLVERLNSPDITGPRDGRLEDVNHALEILEPILRGEAGFVEIFAFLDDDANLIDRLASLLAQLGIDAQTKPVGSITSDLELRGADAFLYTYSIALRCAFHVHRDLGVGDIAERFLLKSVIIQTHLAATYPDTDREIRLAYFLSLFPNNILPPERKLQYLEEGAKILRKAIHFDPKLYMNDMLDTLSEKAERLQEMGRQEDALRTWHEMLELSPHALAIQAQVEDVVVLQVQSVKNYYLTFNTYNLRQPRACQALASDYQSAGQREHALRLAELAVEQFRSLALKDPSNYTNNLASTLVSRINLISSSKFNNIQAAIEEVKTILDQYDDLARSNVDNLNYYNSLMSSLIDGVVEPSIVQSLSLDAVERLRKLNHMFPEAEQVGMSLLERQQDHGWLLAQCDLVDEAARWLETLRDEHCHLTSDDEKIGTWSIYLLLYLATVLKDKGDLEESREALKTAVETGDKLGDIDENTAWWCSLALAYQAEIAGFLGQEELALKLSAGYVSNKHSAAMSRTIGYNMTLVPLHSRQSAINKRYEDALLVVEGSASCLKENLENPSAYDGFQFIWPSEYLRTRAACLADVHQTSEAVVIAKKAVEEARRAKEATNASLRKTAESYHGITLWTLGCVLLFSNDRDGALTVFEEAKELWKRRSKVRKFDLRNLGLVLWALAKLYCLLGQYEAGAAANQKLRKTLKGLESSNPIMHLVVSVAIDQERRRPPWVKFLDSVAKELNHGRLEEVVLKIQRP